ncbi:MAG TPA: zinc ribbon domain-containing protein [Burkholderiales bacterium]|nr:zinc ribbon domain-containing protein [Burkholderiales bacterium]
MTQWLALLASIVTFFIAAVAGALGGYLTTRAGSAGMAMFMTALTALVLFVVMATGLSAVGVMLMDRAKNIEVRSTIDAFVYGLLCLPKFIGMALALAALLLVVMLVAALGYFICKIPGIGPVLLVFAHPVFVFAMAALLTAIAWVAVPLFAPAVWEGRSFGEALSVLLAVTRHRLVAVVVTFLLLYIVVVIIGTVVFGMLAPAYLSMTGVAAGVIGPELSASSFGTMFASIAQLFAGGESRGGGHILAALIATLIIFGLAVSVLAQVWIMGVNLVYLIVTEGLDVTASQAALAKGLTQMKQKAAEAQDRARQAADRARAAAQAAAAAPPAPARAAAMLNCPKCKAVVSAGDPFCNECGFKLGA